MVPDVPVEVTIEPCAGSELSPKTPMGVDLYKGTTRAMSPDTTLIVALKGKFLSETVPPDDTELKELLLILAEHGSNAYFLETEFALVPEITTISRAASLHPFEELPK